LIAPRSAKIVSSNNFARLKTSDGKKIIINQPPSRFLFEINAWWFSQGFMQFAVLHEKNY